MDTILANENTSTNKHHINGIEKDLEVAREKIVELEKKVDHLKTRTALSRSIHSSGHEAQSELSVIRSVWDSSNKNEQLLREDNSHWMGSKRFNENVWRNIGAKHLDYIKTYLQFKDKLRDKFSRKKIRLLEWGPGGGSNLVAFSPYCEAIAAVDISEQNLQETKTQLSSVNFRNFESVFLNDYPNNLEFSTDTQFDVFLCTAVFQHFPSKQYGVDVLKKVKEYLAPGAICYIQIRFDDGSEKFLPRALDGYQDPKNHIYANSYWIHEFSDILTNLGFSVDMIKHINTNVHYVSYYASIPN